MHIGRGVGPVGSFNAVQEAGPLYGVFLGPHGLHHVAGQNAPDLGRTLGLEAPGERAQESRAEPVSHSGWVNGLNIWNRRDLDPILTCCLDDSAGLAMGHDPHPNPALDFCARPAGFALDEGSLVVV